MPCEQLRALVVELLELEDEDLAAEFDTQLTTQRPSEPRTSTLDELIASLRATTAPAPNTASLTKHRRRM